MIRTFKRLFRGKNAAAPPRAESSMPHKKFRVFCECGWTHLNEVGQIQPIRANDPYMAIIKGRALHGRKLFGSVINIDAALNPNTPIHYIDAKEVD